MVNSHELSHSLIMNYFIISGKPHLFGHRDDIENFLNLMSQYNRGYNTFDRCVKTLDDVQCQCF